MKLCQTCQNITGDADSYCAYDGHQLIKDPLASILQEQLGTKYKLTRLIGTGSMGAVYRAQHHALDDVAIKVMLGPPDNHKLSERFLREARALRKLRHQHSVLVYDLERSPTGLTYMVMEMVEGRSLRDVLRERRQLPVGEAMEIAEAVCGALEAAHDHGIIHRDLKPDNILIAEEKTADGETSRIIKIADFGIVKLRGTREGGEEASMQLTKHGAPIGTPFYMSPEQWFGDSGTGFTALDGRSDIYSLGCTIYEMLAGRPPFLGKTSEEMRRKHLNDAPQPLRETAPHVPEALDRAVMRSLEKDRDVRPATAEDFAAELRRAYEGSEAATMREDQPPAQKAPAPSPDDQEAASAEQISELQSTEESDPVVRNWVAEEAQQVIEQVLVLHEVVPPPAPPQPAEAGSRSKAEADTMEDLVGAHSMGEARTEPEMEALGRQPSPELEFQQTMILERKPKAPKPAAPAARPARPEEGAGRNLMVARAGSRRIGIPADEALDVTPWCAPTPLPHAPYAVLGVISMRGRMLTVLDAAALLGDEGAAGDDAPHAFIIALRGDEQLGLAVTSVEGAIGIDPAEIAPHEENGGQGAVLGTVQGEHGSIAVLDAGELFEAALRGGERRRQRTS